MGPLLELSIISDPGAGAIGGWEGYFLAGTSRAANSTGKQGDLD
jgi:hypothetical protein